MSEQISPRSRDGALRRLRLVTGAAAGAAAALAGVFAGLAAASSPGKKTTTAVRTPAKAAHATRPVQATIPTPVPQPPPASAAVAPPAPAPPAQAPAPTAAPPVVSSGGS
jgi:hypothetical protein